MITANKARIKTVKASRIASFFLGPIDPTNHATTGCSNRNDSSL